MNQGPVISESEILARQAVEARAAAVEALNQAKAALQKNMDPRPVLRKHPWVALSVAGAAGFIATLLAVPSKEEQELQRLERIHRATHPDPSPAATNSNGASNGHDSAPKSTIWTSIIHELVQLVRPILLTAITTSINGSASQPPQGRQSPNSPM